MATRTLEIVLAGDASSASRAFRRVEQDSQRMGKSVDREGKRIHGFATLSSKGFSRVGVAAGGMAAAGAAGAALLAKSFVSGATAINESLSKNQVLFGKHAATIDRFTQRTAKNFGISRQAALEATGTFGNLFVALEIGPRKSAGMSVALTKLAADMASFNNASPEETLEAIRSGLVGETEPLRRFGVNLNDATLRTQALKMGLIATVKDALTPQQKALAVNALLFKQTEKAQGDFARTSGGLANQQRILKARFADASAELGGKLMPIALRGVKALNSLFDSSTSGGKAIGAVGTAARVAGKWIKEAYGDAVRAVTQWVNRNREELKVAAEAFRNIGRAAAYVFKEVILPIVRASVRAMVPILEGLRDTLSGLVRFVTNVLTGRWAKAWDAFKDTVRGMLDTVKAIIVGRVQVMFTAVKAIGGAVVKGLVAGLKGLGNAIKNAIVSGVKSGVNAAKGAITDVIGAINPFGDGIGKLAGKIGDGAGQMDFLPQFGGGLMGARPELGPIAGMAQRFGLGVSSGLRPRARTSSGNQSWHATGEAIDVSGPASGMMGFARFMSKRAGSLAELIYTPLGAWSNGSRYTPSGKLAADHYDHVHVAMDVGQPGQGDGLGKFDSTAYGPPWNAMNGTGVTRTGVNLKSGPKRYGVAVDPSVIPLGSMLKITPNPFGYSGAFEAFDTGGAIKGKRLDFYDWRGRKAQMNWGHRTVTVSTVGDSGGGGGASRPTTGSFVGAVGFTGPAEMPGGGSPAFMQQGLAKVSVQRAKAQRDDSLAGLIKAFKDERQIKQRRLNRINKLLKRKRLSMKFRTALLEEKAQLIDDIGALNADIKEYEADQGGGATTITQAEALAAGVAPPPETPPDTTSDNSALIAVMAEVAANQRRLIHLAEVQGPQLVGAVVAAVNGSIGGSLGLGGLQAAGVPGQLARY